MVTGDNTGWTFDSSMSSSDADWHRRRRERSERHSPERNVEIQDSISSDETRDVLDILFIEQVVGMLGFPTSNSYS